MKNLEVYILLCFAILISSCNSNNTSQNKRISDNKVVFDPTGYYIIEDSIRIGDYRFDNLSILTKELDSKDKFVTIDKVFIQLLKIGTDSIKRLEFKDYVINRDKLELKMTDTELGKISLIGKFISKNGPVNDQTDDKTIVLKAKLKVNSDFVKDLDFTWFIGD